MLAAAFAQRPRADVLVALERAGIPAGPINTLADVFADPQVRHRGLRLELSDAATAGGALPGLRTPIRFSDAALATQTRAPRLGEHRAAVCAALAASPDWPAREDAA